MVSCRLRSPKCRILNITSKLIRSKNIGSYCIPLRGCRRQYAVRNCSRHLFVDSMRMGQKSTAGSFMVLKEHVVWHIWTLTIKVRVSKTTRISANFAKVEVNTYELGMSW